MPRNIPTRERKSRRSKVYRNSDVRQGAYHRPSRHRKDAHPVSSCAPAWSERNIIDKYYAEGTVEPNPKGGRRREECVKFEEQHGEYIPEILDEDCTQTLAIVKQRLEEEFPDIAETNVTLAGLWHYIGGRLGFTLKRTKPVEQRQNNEGTINQRYDYVVHRLPERGIAYNTNDIFVDETGFINANLMRGQGWTKRGLTPIVVNATKRAVNLSIIAGISYHGVEDVSVKIVKQGTTGKTFKDFVKGIIKKPDDNNAGLHFFVMDNAFIYKAPIVKELFRDSILQVCLLLPYLPFLNPIEKCCFSKLKTLVKREPHLRGDKKSIEHVRKTSYEASERNCQRWVHHCIQFFEDCAEKRETY